MFVSFYDFRRKCGEARRDGGARTKQAEADPLIRWWRGNLRNLLDALPLRTYEQAIQWSHDFDPCGALGLHAGVKDCDSGTARANPRAVITTLRNAAVRKLDQLLHTLETLGRPSDANDTALGETLERIANTELGKQAHPEWAAPYELAPFEPDSFDYFHVDQPLDTEDAGVPMESLPMPVRSLKELALLAVRYHRNRPEVRRRWSEVVAEARASKPFQEPSPGMTWTQLSGRYPSLEGKLRQAWYDLSRALFNPAQPDILAARNAIMATLEAKDLDRRRQTLWAEGEELVRRVDSELKWTKEDDRVLYGYGLRQILPAIQSLPPSTYRLFVKLHVRSSVMERYDVLEDFAERLLKFDADAAVARWFQDDFRSGPAGRLAQVHSMLATYLKVRNGEPLAQSELCAALKMGDGTCSPDELKEIYTIPRLMMYNQRSRLWEAIQQASRAIQQVADPERAFRLILRVVDAVSEEDSWDWVDKNDVAKLSGWKETQQQIEGFKKKPPRTVGGYELEDPNYDLLGILSMRAAYAEILRSPTESHPPASLPFVVPPLLSFEDMQKSNLLKTAEETWPKLKIQPREVLREYLRKVQKHQQTADYRAKAANMLWADISYVAQAAGPLLPTGSDAIDVSDILQPPPFRDMHTFLLFAVRLFLDPIVLNTYMRHLHPFESAKRVLVAEQMDWKIWQVAREENADVFDSLLAQVAQLCPAPTPPKSVTHVVVMQAAGEVLAVAGVEIYVSAVTEDDKQTMWVEAALRGRRLMRLHALCSTKAKHGRRLYEFGVLPLVKSKNVYRVLVNALPHCIPFYRKLGFVHLRGNKVKPLHLLEAPEITNKWQDVAKLTPPDGKTRWTAETIRTNKTWRAYLCHLIRSGFGATPSCEFVNRDELPPDLKSDPSVDRYICGELGFQMVHRQKAAEKTKSALSPFPVPKRTQDRRGVLKVLGVRAKHRTGTGPCAPWTEPPKEKEKQKEKEKEEVVVVVPRRLPAPGPRSATISTLTVYSRVLRPTRTAADPARSSLFRFLT